MGLQLMSAKTNPHKRKSIPNSTMETIIKSHDFTKPHDESKFHAINATMKFSVPVNSVTMFWHVLASFATK